MTRATPPGIERRFEPTATDTGSPGSPGFALPATLLLVALLTALLAAGLTRVRVDREIAGATDATTSAIAVAWNGLQSYVGTVTLDGCERPIRPVDGDSVRINVPGGYAEVVARVVRRPPDSLANWLYVVRSTGYALRPATGPTPIAQHTVAQFAEWQSGLLSLPAAFTAANGLYRDAGGTGQFHGADEDSVATCPTAPRAGLKVPTGGTPDLYDYDLTGSPLVSASGSGSGIVTAANIDWAATLTPGTIVPDFTSVQNGDMTYPVQLVTGNAVLGSVGATTFGTGLLIVSGDLTVLGTFVQFYGVILVGGRIYFNADDQRFDGLIASGLNRQLGSYVSTGHFGGDYLDIDYNSMYVWRAMRPLSGFTPIPNGRIDPWRDY